MLARTGDSITEMETVALGTAVEDCWEVVETGDAALVVDTDRKVQATDAAQTLLENLSETP
ncbi:hypothetical protein C9J85_12100 [Haloferax sp. wsp5]|nr:hypothetical protein C9J85_12100 [Haloferax sp. wsp5]